MDTIVQAKPIPKIFIRQKINVSTKTSVREVVDGQQRLRTILTFIKDGLLSTNARTRILAASDLVSSRKKPKHRFFHTKSRSIFAHQSAGPEVLDIFSRLNSYAIVLNEQEEVNANHFSSFKILADEIARKYYEYWMNQGIITAKKYSQNGRSELGGRHSYCDGAKASNRRSKYPKNTRSVRGAIRKERRINWKRTSLAVINMIGKIPPEGLSDTEFRRPHLFYSLFTAVAHCMYGLPGLATERVSLSNERLRSRTAGGTALTALHRFLKARTSTH